ncbi:MAG TPA: hypothetical protein VHU91_06155 [Mycobacteriales bacterium]|nr:hypothetical protein [Mycobacteriales bacterium]
MSMPPPGPPPGFPPPPPQQPYGQPYGQQPLGYPQASFPGGAPGGYPAQTRVSASELRPSRWWYGIAAVIAVLFIGGGITAGAVGVLKNSPSLDTKFDIGETATFTLDSGHEASLYAVADGKGRLKCSASEGIKLTGPKGTFMFTDGGDKWERVFNLKSSTDGKHQVTCSSDDDITKLAIGDKANTGGLAGSVAALLCGPCVGIIIAAAIVLVVALRRKSHKDRMIRDRNGSGGYPPAFGPPQGAPGFLPGYPQQPPGGYPPPSTGYGGPQQPPSYPPAL